MAHPGLGDGSAWAARSHAFRAQFVAMCNARGWHQAELYAALHMLSDGTLDPCAGVDEWSPYGECPCTRIGMMAVPEALAKSAIGRVVPVGRPPDEHAHLADLVPSATEWATWAMLKMYDWEQLQVVERILVRVERDGGYHRAVDYALAGLGIWHEAAPEQVIARSEEPGFQRLRRLVRVPAHEHLITVADVGTEVEARLQACVRLGMGRGRHGR